MDFFTLYGIYAKRKTIKKVLIALIVLLGGFAFFLYLVVSVVFAVIQGNAR